MKILGIHGRFSMVRLASMVVFCVAIGILGTQQRAEGWSAGPLFGVTDLPYGGAHGMMAENVILWLDSSNLLPADYLSTEERQLLRDGASTPDGIWGPGVDFKNTWWWEGALQLQGMIGRDIVEWDIFEYSCTDEPCFTFKDDWENDFDNLMNHEFADLSVWNPIKYWADKAKQDLINNNRSRAMVHAGYAMHFAQDYLNPPHLGPLLWGSYQEVGWPLELELDWETNDYNYIPKAWSAGNFRLVARCFTSDNAFSISFENDLLSYRHSTALAWPTLPSLVWINEQGNEGVILDQRIANAVMWSEQAAHEVLQYIFDLKPPGGCKPGCDFDGDTKSDITIWRPGDGYWYTISSKDGSIMPPRQWGSGALNDVPVAGDYDGDGITDYAVWRPGEYAYWYILKSSDDGIIVEPWGTLTDKPVPRDYDGDGITDIAVWRPSEGFWYIIRSTDGGMMQTRWGAGYPPYNDVPVPADYDGDGKTDIAIWREADGYWYIINSKDGSITSKQWGSKALNDVLVPADYDGDGKTDIAVWRPSEGFWYIISSKDGSIITRQWGAGYAPYNDLPVPGDYDGDGKTDVAVWRPTDGYWYVINSKDGSVTATQWGAGYPPYNDKPISQKQNW